MRKKRLIAFILYMIILFVLLIAELFFKINIFKYVSIFAGILIAIQLFTSVPFPDGGLFPLREVESRAHDTHPFFPSLDFWIWTLGFALYLFILFKFK